METKPNGNGHKELGRTKGQPKVSKLGQRLRELSDKALSSGTTTLSNAQIQKLISEARGRI
jgi:hypothetical protein